MFENLDTGSIVMSTISVVVLILAIIIVVGKSMDENKPTKVHDFLFALMLVAIIMPFIDSNHTSNYISENTKYFNDGVTMKCYGGFTPYLVSKDNGWSINGESFVKDDFIADMTRCFLIEENK